MYFLGFNLRFVLYNYCNIVWRFLIVFLNFLLWIMMLLKQRRYIFYGKLDNFFFIRRSKVVGVLQRLKVMTVNWYKLLLVLKVVFGLFFLFIVICQYLLKRFRVKNYLYLVSVFKQSLIFGRGQLFLIVISLSLRQFTQKRVDLFFFLIKIMGDVQGFEGGLIIFFLSMFLSNVSV